MKRFRPALLVCCLSLSPLLGCNSNPPTPLPPPPPNSWLILLCTVSDNATEPHPTTFYSNLFDRNQRNLLFDYFDVVSNHTVDVSGTQVFGWFPMSVTAAQVDPMVRNNGTPVKRDQTARDCKASALGGMAGRGFTVDPANFVGVITVINVPVDSGATGERGVVLNGEPALSFWEHEMLHEWGPRLPDSWITSPDTTSDHQWNHGGDAMYSDCCDIMSCCKGVETFPTPSGDQGPELQAIFRSKLNWLPAGRITAAGRGSSTTKLAPLSDPSKAGSLLLTVEVLGRSASGSYLVEYRENTGFDRGIPNPRVLIREYRGGTTYLVRKSNSTSAWRAGDLFTDTENFISISVDQIISGEATVTVNTLFSPGAVGAGEICGDKYHGEVRPCPAGLRCDAKRSGQLVSIDYFCLP